MLQSITSVITQLSEHFVHVYDLWDKKQSRASYKKMLEHDVMMLGFYFADIDEFGQVAKFSVVCEAIALVRLIDNPISSMRAIDYWTDVVMEELHAYRIAPPEIHKASMEELIHHLKTWKIVRELYQKKQISDEVLAQFKQSMVTLVDLFVMYDGNITDKEIQSLRAFEEHLSERAEEKWRASSVTLSYMEAEVIIAAHVQQLDSKEAIDF